MDLIGIQTVSIRYERRFSEILQFQLINKTSGPHPKRGRQQQGAWLTGWWPGSGSHVATTSCVSTWTQDSKIRSEAPLSHFEITWFPFAMRPARAVPRRHKTQRWGQNLRTHFKVTFTIGNGIPPLVPEQAYSNGGSVRPSSSIPNSAVSTTVIDTILLGYGLLCTESSGILYLMYGCSTKAQALPQQKHSYCIMPVAI